MIYRLNSLKLISEWTNRELNRQLAVQGKSYEPEPAAHEKSHIIKEIFKSLRDDGFTRKSIVGETWGLNIDEIDHWTFFLAQEYLDNERTARIRRSNLHVLEN